MANPKQLFDYKPVSAPAEDAASFDPALLTAAILLAREGRAGQAYVKALTGDTPKRLFQNQQRVPVIVHVRANVNIDGNGAQHWLLLGADDSQVQSFDNAAYVMAPAAQEIVTVQPEQSLYGRVSGQTDLTLISPIGIVEADLSRTYNMLKQLVAQGLFR